MYCNDKCPKNGTVLQCSTRIMRPKEDIYPMANTEDPVQTVSKRRNLGPVVQSIVSLMSSLRGQLDKCFTTL